MPKVRVEALDRFRGEPFEPLVLVAEGVEAGGDGPDRGVAAVGVEVRVADGVDRVVAAACECRDAAVLDDFDAHVDTDPTQVGLDGLVLRDAARRDGYGEGERVDAGFVEQGPGASRIV